MIPSVWQQKAGFTKANKAHVGSDGDVTFEHPEDPRQTENEMPILEELRGTGQEPTLEMERHQETKQDQAGVQDRPEAPAAGEQQLPEDGSQTRRMSGRRKTPSGRLRESLESRMLMTSLCVPWDVHHDESLDEQDRVKDPTAFAVSTNPDMMCCDDAMKAPDHAKFQKAMLDEVQSHTDNDHLEITHRSEVPAGQPTLPAVWAFRRKRRISTNEVHKWKSRLNVHGGKQLFGVNCWDTHAPVVGWSTVRLFLNLMMLSD